MRRWTVALVLIAIVAVVVVGLLQAGGDESSGAERTSLSRAEVTRPLAGQPPVLAALHRRSGQLVPGGVDRFDSELRALRGFPVVVNLWASWCGPCKYEIPFLQRQFREHGTKVAFLGVNSDDTASGARDAAAKLPMPYPSVVDPRANLAGRLGARGLPVTVFYDRQGRLAYVHQGAYPDVAHLAADIERYAGA